MATATMFPSAFARLRGLLAGLEPSPGAVRVDLHLGEYRGETPAAALGALADPAGWCRYPPLGGTEPLRSAYLGWLDRRFGAGAARAAGMITAEPTAGSKHGVATAIAVAVGADRACGAPRVVLPNPFYPTYLAATDAAGASAVFYPVGGGTDAAPVEQAVASALARAGGHASAVVLCSPGNPRGDVVGPSSLRRIGELAAAADAVLIVDECYVDLGLRGRPPGFLPVAEAMAATGASFLVLHTLSKRSGAPGLRSGFVTGDTASVAAFAAVNRSCGVSSPLPVCAAATALWSDDAHVAQRREAIVRAWAVADRILGDMPGYRRADAGFFLWLPVGDDEAAARALWRDAGLRVMPGRYLGADQPGGNPGAGHLRIALVHDEGVLGAALERLREVLDG